jgi:hypothetical protein
MASKAFSRLSQIANSIIGTADDDNKFPWNPDRKSFPKRSDLPSIPGAPSGAAWVWGPDDNLGRLNLLTPNRVFAASKEIKTGEIVPVKYVFQILLYIFI